MSQDNSNSSGVKNQESKWRLGTTVIEGDRGPDFKWPAIFEGDRLICTGEKDQLRKAVSAHNASLPSLNEPEAQAGNTLLVPQMELRVKVAELCGWTNIHLQFPDNPQSSLLGENLTMLGHGAAYIPDYPNDLNACAEMEKHIPDEKNLLYWKHLVDICCEFPGTPVERATAEQRCRAFIATMEEKQ